MSKRERVLEYIKQAKELAESRGVMSLDIGNGMVLLVRKTKTGSLSMNYSIKGQLVSRGLFESSLSDLS